MSKARDLADLIAAGNPLADGAINVSEISDLTATAAEINKLDGLTATTAELNNVVGSTSSLQSQLDNVSVTSGSLTKTFTNGESATITLSQSISPAPVVEVTKEVAQTGQSSKGAWDVNATASNYDLHNTAYSTTLTPSQVGNANISDATYANKSFSTTTQDATPKAAFFKTDGTVMYVIGYNADYVSQYTLSTAWDVSTATYANKNFYVGTLETGPTALYITDDGLTGFYTGIVTDVIKKFTMSTAWDISTASDTSNTLNVNAQETSPRGIWFKPDGTKLYMIGGNSYAVFEYGLSTAWDLTTASLTTNFNVGVQDNSPRGVTFNSTGTKMYVAGGTNSDIFQYTLSTAWDVSSASYDSVSLDITPQDAGLSDVFIGDNGSKIYATGDSNGAIYQYDNGSPALVLGTGSFASTDVGKRIQGNGGDVILTSTAGAYSTTGGSAFTDSSTIASGSWTMHGLKSAGDADGLTLSNYVVGYGDVDTYSYDSVLLDLSGQISVDSTGLWFKPDGTAIFLMKYANDRLYKYNLSTAWDLTTASYGGDVGIPTANGSNHFGLSFNPDGTRLFVANTGFDYLSQYNLSTAWDITTISHYNSIDMSSATYGSNNNPAGMAWNDDGTKLYITSTAGDKVTQLNLQNAYTLISNQVSLVTNFSTVSQVTSPSDVAFNSDGTKMFVVSFSNSNVYQYSLSTAFALSTASYDGKVFGLSSQSSNMYSIFFKDGGQKFYALGIGSDGVYQYSSGSAYLPTSQYNLAVTNASGQIDSSFWTDINSMTADQSLGDGEAYYAVSTDDRTTWSVAKASDGVRPIVRDNAGTWQYNTAATTSYYGIADASYDSKSFSVSSQTSSIRETHFNTTGTKMYVISDGSDRIYEYDLSTAFDVSTATYNSANFSVLGQLGGAQGFCFNNNGTKMYVVGEVNDTVYQYSLSTAFDITTASYDSVSLSIGGQQAVAGTVIFNDDGTKMFICGESENYIRQYTLTTAFNVGTATAESTYLDHSTQTTSVTGMAFNNDGTKIFLASRSSESVIYQYSLTTAYDVSTATYDAISFNVAPQLSATFQGIVFSNDGSKLYVTDNSGVVLQYSTESTAYTTSTTWTNATTNDEFYALQQALGATSVNRMDKTQLDAVADGSHFTLGNTLDLMIALKQDTASASLPTSDGVTINYDAEALNQGAVLGTDYNFDFPANNKVRITSNAAQNLKIRVV